MGVSRIAELDLVETACGRLKTPFRRVAAIRLLGRGWYLRTPQGARELGCLEDCKVFAGSCTLLSCPSCACCLHSYGCLKAPFAVCHGHVYVIRG